MKVAIIGLPQSGKTTLAAAATGFMPQPGGMPRVHHATVKVPDERLNTLAEMFSRTELVEATIEHIDVPGLSLADHKGQEDLRRFLPDMRQSDMLLAVIRAFHDPAVPAYRNRIDPEADFKELTEELFFADFETISTRLEKIEKALTKPTKTHDQEKREHAVLTHCREALEKSQPLSTVLANQEDRRFVSNYGLLTLKRLLVVYNVAEEQAAAPDPPAPANTVGAINLCARTEWEIAQLDPADRSAFLADLGVQSPAGQRLIRQCYQALGLISFLTIGDDQVRAWTIEQGVDAVQAAGKVHSDIARGFIRAETVAYDDFIAAGDMKAAKAAGKVRQEGKTYVVQDGDIINFKFNV